MTAKLIIKACIFVLISIVSCNAYAEYYVVFSSPSPPTEYVSCNKTSYVKTHHVYHYDCHHRHHYNHHYRHAAHSHSSATIYVWHNTPPACDAYTTCNVSSQHYRAYYAEPADHTEAYITEYEGHDFDRATSDDVEPDMNIDN